MCESYIEVTKKFVLTHPLLTLSTSTQNRVFQIALLITLISGLGTDSLPSQAAQKSESTPHSVQPIYLYGEIPKPRQLRHTYIVFQEHTDQIVGAFYQPRSEFSCFVGTIDDGILSLEMFAARGFDQTTREVALPNLYALDAISVTDQQMLTRCKKAISNQGEVEQIPVIRNTLFPTSVDKK